MEVVRDPNPLKTGGLGSNRLVYQFFWSKFLTGKKVAQRHHGLGVPGTGEVNRHTRRGSRKTLIDPRRRTDETRDSDPDRRDTRLMVVAHRIAQSAGWRPSTRRCAAAAAVAGLLATGCSPPGSSSESYPEVLLTAIDAPLHDPVWSYHMHTLAALTDDRRVATIAMPDQPGPGQTRLSAPLGAGHNLQISQKDERVAFVGRPEREAVAAIDLHSLEVVDQFDAGPAPSYLSEDAGQRVLLALSADGKSVTPVEQYGYSKLPTANISGEPAERIDGANRGRAIEYHLYDRSGIRYYKGPASPPEHRASLAMDIAAAAGDSTKSTRSYVAENGKNAVYAVDFGHDGEDLTIVGEAILPSSAIRYLGTDDTRLYAATDHHLVVLETASFKGYRDGAIPVIDTIDYRSGLPHGVLRSTPLSGMAIGPDRVYLSLTGQPNLISVGKPHL